MTKDAVYRMGESMKAVRALGLCALIWAVATLGAAGAIEVYPVSQVQRGVVGVGYTVVEGTTIEPFSVEILGVLERAGPAGSLILVRAFGDLIDRVGGIASGMSGSPVYVDGKLLGAIGYGFQLADHRIGLVTPAEDMLEVMSLIDAGSLQEPELLPPEGQWVELPKGIVLADSTAEARKLKALLPEDVWVATPVSTPLMVSGLGPRTMGRLRELFSNYDVVPMQAGGSLRDSGIEAPLAPGAALGVQLVRGDVDITAIGTLTAIDGDRFVGFGHQFLGRGEVDHFVTGAYIYTTVSSISFPFKIGAPLDTVGSLLQDRGAGIAGVLGRAPDSIHLRVRVADRDREVERDFRVEVARDAELTVPLMVVSALEAVDRALDRLGPGTSRVNFRIDGSGMPRALVRENVFYSSSDIAAASLSELLVASELLQENEFQDPVIQEVSVDIEVESTRRTARIERAEPKARRVRPGETVDVVVTLRPFRERPFEVTVPLEIPPDVGRGPVTVSVRGGTFGGYAGMPEATDDLVGLPSDEGEGEEAGPITLQAESLEKLIDEFEKEPRNNEVVVEFYPPSFFDAGRDLFRGGPRSAPEEEPPGEEPPGDPDEPEELEEPEEDPAPEAADSAEAEEPSAPGDPDGASEPGEADEGEKAGEPGEAAEPGESSGDDAGFGHGPSSSGDNAIGDNGHATEESPGDDDQVILENDEGAEAVDEEALEEPAEYRPIRATYPTAYVVHGEVQFPLTILPAREMEEDEPESEEPAPAPPADPFREPDVFPIDAR